MTLIVDNLPTASINGGRLLRSFGIALLVLGIAAIVLPQAATLATEVLVGAVLLISGIVSLMLTLGTRGIFGWRNTGVLAILSIIAGILLLAAPAMGAQILTAILGILFLLEGVLFSTLGISMGKQADNRIGTGWLIFNAATAALVGILILLGLPASATWAIGLLVGIKLVTSGFTLYLVGKGVSAMNAEPGPQNR